MNNIFFIGDAFMIQKKSMAQTIYSFLGAKKLDNTNTWEIVIQSAINNGYAGGSSTINLEVKLNEEFRVSGTMRGFIKVDGFNSEKIKEKPIKAIKFIEIEKDMIKIEFVM